MSQPDRRLVAAFLKESNSPFAPKTITELVGRLTEEGFVEGSKLTDEAYESIYRPTRWQRATAISIRGESL